MATIQFTVQQVSFPSDEFPEDSSSVDSLSSVVDPNVDFISNVNPSEIKPNDLQDLKDNWNSKSSVKTSENMDEKELEASTIKDTSYPTIPLEVAHDINKNNPEFYQEAEKYLNKEILSKPTSTEDFSAQKTSTSSSPLHSLSVTSGALALQQSVIGNASVKPVSPDVVAQIVADTKLRIQQGQLPSVPLKSELTKKILNVEMPNSSAYEAKENIPKPELIRYPSSSITSVVEKCAWFSTSSAGVLNNSPRNIVKSSTKESILHSRSSSQSSISSFNLKKGSITNNSDLPKVHTSKALNLKASRNTLLDNSPYEIYPDSSVEYETESSMSEKFEVESLCSEAFETESNFSEVSGIDDEIFHLRKNISNSLHNEKMINNSTQANVTVSHVNTSPIKLLQTSDKAVETDEYQQFQLLREKANLEGRLQSICEDQNHLAKERDHFRNLAVSFEAQVKSLQNQLNSALLEKKNALQSLELHSMENKNWDSVIKEYQNIIEVKASEIKALKEDLSQSEQAHTQTKINFEELKVEMESKEGAIAGLKKKIAELHVEVQILMQGKVQLENEIKNVRLEMDTLQKSKEWFQDQLHAAQSSRNKLHQELIFLQRNQVSTSNNLEKLEIEKNQICQELVQTQQRAMAEKEVLKKHLETIEADMKERESLFDDIQNDKGTAEAVLVERIRKLEEEKTQSTNLALLLSDQEHQLSVLRTECNDKLKLIETLEKEKVEFSRQIAILQKSFYDKDSTIQHLNQEVKDLSVRLKHAEMSLSHSEELISTLKEERTATDIALAAANEEKRVVNESLKTVSENLNKFKHNFKLMKIELVSKSSKVEQLSKEKQMLEEALKKNEDSMFVLQNEFQQQVQSENKNRDVMLDDLRKKKSEVENILNVYSQDMMNLQQTVESLSKQNNSLTSETSSLRSSLDSEIARVKELSYDNMILKEKLMELEKQELNYADELSKSESTKNSSFADPKKLQMLQRAKKLLYKKLKEKITECNNLRKELDQMKVLTQENKEIKLESNNTCSSSECQKKIEDLKGQLTDLKAAVDKYLLQLKENEVLIIELEREKGKAIGFSEKFNNLKEQVMHLESKLGEKDSKAIQLASEVNILNGKLSELDTVSKSQISSLETALNKERTLIKSLRQQIFQEKRSNSHLQRDITTLKYALDQANQIADSRKQDISNLQSELDLKIQAELKHRTDIEHYQSEIHIQHSVVEKLNKELQEIKARDPALAEQIKSLSWQLKEKSNEVAALKEKLTILDEKYKIESENLKQSFQICRSDLENVKKELSKTREEKFSYQTKVMDLRKALKSKLEELEKKGILKVNNKESVNGPVANLNTSDPELAFDATYVNDLLQKSMNLTASRPLSNLQECLNSLKEEMVQLQKKIIENAENS